MASGYERVPARATLAGATLENYIEGNPNAWRRVIDAAAKLFCQRGFSTVTMQDIASAVGLSKAGLYHHCPSKEQILADIVRLCGEILLRQLAATRALDVAPVDRLKSFVVSRMETIAQYQDLFTIIWQERPFINGAAFDAIAKSAESYRAGVRTLIEECKREGSVRAGVDTHLLMLAIDGMTGWAYVWFKRNGNNDPTSIGNAFWDFIAAGVVPPAPT